MLDVRHQEGQELDAGHELMVAPEPRVVSPLVMDHAAVEQGQVK